MYRWVNPTGQDRQRPSSANNRGRCCPFPRYDLDVRVEILVGHQSLVPKLVVKMEMLQPLVLILLKVELTNNLKGTRVRGAKRPLTPSLTSWEVGYASCSASTKGLFPRARDTVSLVPGEQKCRLFSRGMEK